MGGKKDKNLEKISQMPRKARDLIPASDAVKSAIAYMKTLETFFEEKSNSQIDVYPLLAKTLKGAQLDNQPAAISGRLFFDLNCFIQKNETKGIMQRELKEISSKEVHNRKHIYNFVSKEVVSTLGDLIKSKDFRQVDPLLESIVLNIQSNPAWITFWQDRVGVVGIDEDLQKRVLQSLVYKIAGDCHHEYLATKKPSLEEQKSAIGIINAFKLGALKVSPVLSAILADSSDISPRPRANAFLQPRTPGSPIPSAVKAKSVPLSRVKQMAEDYQRKIDDIKAQSEPISPKVKPNKKR